MEEREARKEGGRKTGGKEEESNWTIHRTYEKSQMISKRAADKNQSLPLHTINSLVSSKLVMLGKGKGHFQIK